MRLDGRGNGTKKSFVARGRPGDRRKKSSVAKVR
jgi:hypothetical protein